MLDKALGTFVTIVKAYYPPEEVIVENGTIAVAGYLGRLMKYLLKRGNARKFVFVTYLIEYVDYKEAMDRTEQFIEELTDIGVIYRDSFERDVYRVSKIGFDVFRKIEIRSGRG
jgi:hypothetical protein